ncbi:O-methyltransferase [Actinokineospora auranticolor]|uniref:Caffeoyl-CoA O-methyltransferase n=1 Tax=Actinokineospora auranticolor TaxID=155976 RepID=A0A2S6GFG4_9PSEU|nr:O-methyltransferase [Actinokineospora auranticolor]PPK63886.1 caffeoyl-CoA O-methyltransferase [Actinokineospora auranticolor]
MDMDHRIDIVDPAINDYVLAHSSPGDDLLRDLAAETAADHGDVISMQISHEQGEFLTMLARLTGARFAVEIGVFTGYSSICIARGLAEGGTLLACDVSEEWTAVARKYWARAGVTDRIDLRLAPAVETLRSLPLDPVIDFAFIDADKTGYADYYEEILVRLRPGGLIVLDNMLQEGRIIDPAAQDEQTLAIRAVNDMIVADDRVSAVLLPLRDGVTLVRKH